MNPYEPSPTAETPNSTKSPTFRLVGRVFVAMYGVTYLVICIADIIDQIASQKSHFEIGFWLAVDLLACFGVFALAFPLLRFRRLASFWRYFSIALPFVFLAGAILEFPSVVETSPQIPMVAVWFIFAIGLAFIAMAVVFNFMLSNRLQS